MNEAARSALRALLVEVPVAMRPIYAVLDGARTPRIRELLVERDAEALCLFQGELSPRLAAAAPWLVKLDPDSDLFRALLEEGWGESWGIFLAATAPLAVMRRHLRGFLRVRDEDGRRLFFRWYDPRILRLYLPTTNEHDRRIVVGGAIRLFVMEGEDPSEAVVFRVGRDQVLHESRERLGDAAPRAAAAGTR